MDSSSQTLEKRLAILQRAIPLSMVVFVLAYQLGVARWVHHQFGEDLHYLIEILFFATSGPLLAFWTLAQIKRWVTEKSRAEEQARAHRSRLAAITSASADAIVGVDPDGLIDSWNLGAELLFGYRREQAVEQPLSLLFGEGEAAALEIDWLIEETKSQGIVRGHETRGRGAGGRPVQVEITATRIPGDRRSLGVRSANSSERQQPQGFSFILRDITRRKQREAEIRTLNARLNQQVEERTRQLAEKIEQLAQANQELQKLDQTRMEFVSLVSHQVRAPLTNLRGAMERMQSDCAALNPTCGRMFTIIEQQTERLDRLVRDVLSAARLETGELRVHLEPVSLQPTIEQTVRQLSARLSDRAVRFAEKPGLPLVYGDRDRITEVLVNLLDNADKYSPSGGEITVSLRATETEVTVSVRDQGPGLPEEEIERLFEKFARTDGSDSQSAYGYGLGLYVCRRLVEAQGGRIWAENHPEGGALLSFSLPVWQGGHA